MNKNTERRFHAVRALALGDEEYYQLLKENGQLERQYDQVLSTLPAGEQDVIQDFLSSCEGLSWRMLEIACTVMRFPTAEEAIHDLECSGAPPEYIALCLEFLRGHGQ